MLRSPTRLIALAAGLFAAAATPARAQTPTTNTGSAPATAPATADMPLTWQTGQATTGTDDPGFFAGILKRENLLGDMGGLRTWLGRYGVTLDLTSINEAFGNASGGVQRGISGNGLTTITLTMDTGSFGLDGGTIKASGLWIYGPNFSNRYLANLQTVSGIAAEPTFRLWELWYQQQFLDGKLDLKVGQQSVDQEFMVSDNSALFLNTMMGWPMLPSADLYAGGPAYPLSSLGVRLRGKPTDQITVLGGVFNDNPPGGPFDDSGQLRGAERYGALFNLNTGALVLGEIQYSTKAPVDGQITTGPAQYGLPGTYRLGFWFDSAKFPDQRFDNTGLSQADPDTSGVARYHWHNYSIYAVADQVIWRPDPDKNPDSHQVLSLFVRPMFAPTNQNLIDFSINGGMTLKAPLPGRDDDTFGIGFGVANVSNRAAQLDRDTIAFGGAYMPVRGAETFLEITYQAQITPWLQVQPDFQYFWMPGGGLVNPNEPTKRIGNEAVFGLRSTIVF